MMAGGNGEAQGMEQPSPPDLEVSGPGKQERQTVVLSQASAEQPAKAQPAAASSRYLSPQRRPLATNPAPIARQQSAGGPQAPQYNFIQTYQIYPDNPDVYVGIKKDPETGGFRYMVVEPKLTLWEKQVYQKLTRLLVDELEVDMTKLKNNKSAEAYLVEEAKKLSKKYGIKVPPSPTRRSPTTSRGTTSSSERSRCS